MLNGFHGYLLDALNIAYISVLHYPFRLDGYTEGKEAVPLFYYSISPPPLQVNVLIITKLSKRPTNSSVENIYR